jgi:hypothetical protein
MLDARPIAWNRAGTTRLLLTSEGDGKVAVRVVQVTAVTAGTTHGLKLYYVETRLERAVKQHLSSRERERGRGRRVRRAARQHFPSGLYQWPRQHTAGPRVAIWELSWFDRFRSSS